MPSLLPTFQATLEAVFVATAPPTPPTPPEPDPDGGLAYRWIDTFTEERGLGQHREMLWGRPVRLAPQSRVSRMVEWELRARLFLHRRDRTERAFGVALSHEIDGLDRAYRRRLSLGWGDPNIHSAVLDTIETEDVQPSPTRRAGGVRAPLVAVVTFPFRVLIREES